MHIENNKVVSFHYRLSEPGQAVFEDSHAGQAAVYLHGQQNMLAGLEEAMLGKQVGDKFTVTLPPEKAYGTRRPDAIQRVSIKHVVDSGVNKRALKPGMVVQLNTGHATRDVTVVKVGLKTIDVDTNHPLAGRTLCFDVEVVDVREASAEEIAHGHAHGVGGHEH